MTRRALTGETSEICAAPQPRERPAGQSGGLHLRASQTSFHHSSAPALRVSRVFWPRARLVSDDSLANEAAACPRIPYPRLNAVFPWPGRPDGWLGGTEQRSAMRAPWKPPLCGIADSLSDRAESLPSLLPSPPASRPLRCFAFLPSPRPSHIGQRHVQHQQHKNNKQCPARWILHRRGRRPATHASGQVIGRVCIGGCRPALRTRLSVTSFPLSSCLLRILLDDGALPSPCAVVDSSSLITQIARHQKGTRRRTRSSAETVADNFFRHFLGHPRVLPMAVRSGPVQS